MDANTRTEIVRLYETVLRDAYEKLAHIDSSNSELYKPQALGVLISGFVLLATTADIFGALSAQGGVPTCIAPALERLHDTVYSELEHLHDAANSEREAAERELERRRSGRNPDDGIPPAFRRAFHDDGDDDGREDGE